MKMIIKYFYSILVLLAIWFYSTTNSYLSELAFLDEWKTIKELKQNIKKLDKTQLELSKELVELNADYKLKLFLKKDLYTFEINNIKKIIFNYNTNKAKIESILFEKAKSFLSVLDEKKLLLEEKRSLYNWLIPYIDQKYKKEYLEYVKWDAKIFSEQKDLTANIIVKKEILNEKVENIETKIKQYKDFTNESIKKVINNKLEEKITNLKNNVTFQVLNNESKIAVLNKTIRKIKIKLLNLENSETNSWTVMITKRKSTMLEQKIQTYNIAIEKLKAFRNSLKDNIKVK